MAWGARVDFQKNHDGKKQMREHRGQNSAPPQAWPLRAAPAYRPPPSAVRRTRAGQFRFDTAHRGVEEVLKKEGTTRHGAELPNGRTLLHQSRAPG